MDNPHSGQDYDYSGEDALGPFNPTAEDLLNYSTGLGYSMLVDHIDATEMTSMTGIETQGWPVQEGFNSLYGPEDTMAQSFDRILLEQLASTPGNVQAMARISETALISPAIPYESPEIFKKGVFTGERDEWKFGGPSAETGAVDPKLVTDEEPARAPEMSFSYEGDPPDDMETPQPPNRSRKSKTSIEVQTKTKTKASTKSATTKPAVKPTVQTQATTSRKGKKRQARKVEKTPHSAPHSAPQAPPTRFKVTAQAAALRDGQPPESSLPEGSAAAQAASQPEGDAAQAASKPEGDAAAQGPPHPEDRALEEGTSAAEQMEGGGFDPLLVRLSSFLSAFLGTHIHQCVAAANPQAVFQPKADNDANKTLKLARLEFSLPPDAYAEETIARDHAIIANSLREICLNLYPENHCSRAIDVGRVAETMFLTSPYNVDIEPEVRSIVNVIVQALVKRFPDLVGKDLYLVTFNEFLRIFYGDILRPTIEEIGTMFRSMKVKTIDLAIHILRDVRGMRGLKGPELREAILHVASSQVLIHRIDISPIHEGRLSTRYYPGQESVTYDEANQVKHSVKEYLDAVAQFHALRAKEAVRNAGAKRPRSDPQDEDAGPSTGGMSSSENPTLGKRGRSESASDRAPALETGDEPTPVSPAEVKIPRFLSDPTFRFPFDVGVGVARFCTILHFYANEIWKYIEAHLTVVHEEVPGFLETVLNLSAGGKPGAIDHLSALARGPIGLLGASLMAMGSFGTTEVTGEQVVGHKLAMIVYDMKVESGDTSLCDFTDPKNGYTREAQLFYTRMRACIKRVIEKSMGRVNAEERLATVLGAPIAFIAPPRQAHIRHLSQSSIQVHPTGDAGAVAKDKIGALKTYIEVIQKSNSRLSAKSTELADRSSED